MKFLTVAVLSLLSSFGNGKESKPIRYMVQGVGAKEAARSFGGKVVMEIPKRGITALEFDNEAMVDKLKDVARRSNFKIEEDQIREIVPGISSAEKEKMLAESIPWGISRTYEKNGVVEIPDDSYFPDDVVHPICVIDSGYDVDHPDLPNDADGINGGWSNDTCDHGTHVSGTIAAIGGNNIGVVGVWPGAPDVKVVKVFNNFIFICLFTYSSGLIGAAQDCQDAGAKITTMSLGGAVASNMENVAFQELYDEGMLHIAAAGNEGNGSCSYPACYDSVMSVGATDEDNNIASFSQYNSQTEISGPGVDVRSTVPNNQYDIYDGTSMATPHVSGAALVLWNKVPTATNTEVRNALNAGAIDLGAPGRDNYYGNGLLNYWNSLDILNAPDECTDSTLNVAGLNISCTDIIEPSTCESNAAKSHCPNTCSACDDFDCVDSTVTWVFNGSNYECAQLATVDQDFKDQACGIEDISSTCRASCGVCE